MTSQLDVDLTEVRFEYQRSACNTGTVGYSQSYLGDLFLRDDFTLDYCLFTCEGDSSSYEAAELDQRLPPVGERIYISGHPLGGIKKLSVESDLNTGGVCRVDFSPTNGRGVNSDVGYYCDTTNGSSGSPVWSGDTNKIVALHHFGGCPNSGGRMDLIYPQIQSLLTGCAPSSCGNTVCDPGETTCNCAVDCGAPPASETPGATCTDGVNNDCDAFTDCADADCATDPACCRAQGASCTSNADCCSKKCRGPSGRKTCR